MNKPTYKITVEIVRSDAPHMALKIGAPDIPFDKAHADNYAFLGPVGILDQQIESIETTGMPVGHFDDMVITVGKPEITEAD